MANASRTGNCRRLNSNGMSVGIIGMRGNSTSKDRLLLFLDKKTNNNLHFNRRAACKHSTTDEMELEGEIKKTREENVSLQSRLLNSDMEIQTMKSKVASLGKELETFKANRPIMNTQEADLKVYLSDPDDYKLPTNDSDDLPVKDFLQDESETEENVEKRAEGEGIEKFKDSAGNEQQQDYADGELTEHSEAAEGDKQKEGTSQGSLVHNRLSQAKRKYSLQQNVISSEETKKSKVDQ